jgi:hypothetical protein
MTLNPNDPGDNLVGVFFAVVGMTGALLWLALAATWTRLKSLLALALYHDQKGVFPK